MKRFKWSSYARRPVFAWLPIKLEVGKWVWLEKVMRKVSSEWQGASIVHRWVYSKNEKKVLMYPDDGGLKEPVRSFDSTYSAIDCLNDAIKKAKKTKKQGK